MSARRLDAAAIADMPGSLPLQLSDDEGMWSMLVDEDMAPRKRAAAGQMQEFFVFEKLCVSVRVRGTLHVTRDR